MPRTLRRDLVNHEVSTVQETGWAGRKNGALLRVAGEAGFAALITVDRGIEFQQSVAGLSLGVVALRVRSNDINDLRPLLPQVEVALRSLHPGSVVHVPELANER